MCVAKEEASTKIDRLIAALDRLSSRLDAECKLPYVKDGVVYGLTPMVVEKQNG